MLVHWRHAERALFACDAVGFPLWPTRKGKTSFTELWLPLLGSTADQLKQSIV